MASTNNGSSAAPHLTPTHKRMLKLLEDGQPHTLVEMRLCLWDEKAESETVDYHVTSLRKSLRLQGREIVWYREERVRFFQLVQFINYVKSS